MCPVCGGQIRQAFKGRRSAGWRTKAIDLGDGPIEIGSQRQYRTELAKRGQFDRGDWGAPVPSTKGLTAKEKRLKIERRFMEAKARRGLL